MRLAKSLATVSTCILFVAALAQRPVRAAQAIPAINERMKEFVAQGEIAGAVTLVADKDKILHLDATGRADLSSESPISRDAMFWIASMSKPITGVAVMIMQDEGKLSLDDSVEKYIPEFANYKTADGKKATITIKNLLTHSSGMPEATVEESKSSRTLAELVPHFLNKPLQFAPGSKWQYCQSSINTAGRIVEIVSGQSFDRFVQDRIFAPLDMKDTTFYLTEPQSQRLAKSYKKADGKLTEAQIFILDGKSPVSRERYPAANGGLFSTALDYARFCQMLLNNGELNGRRILKPESVKQFSTVQFPDLKTGFTPGNGWGVGCCIVREPQGVTAMLSPGTYGHGGAYGTQAWIDPQKNLIYILMVQRANFLNADNSDVRKAFQQAASEALAK
ncbi:MAG TPA: serine hydrolase domain-containing protein [Tepidisphaeraceae bacterium]|jgi:CubicO group peptidase (beta-lactamase class C family)|nr:serine hydrolase domain-containing protein [Tepidisphaeraceae bacterium]